MSAIDFQRKILGDQVRNRAFAEALRNVVKKGKTTVADIGAGTGFLSFVAAKLGARECYLYEHSGALQIAEKLARANRIENCHFYQEHTSQIINPPKVDLVISETLGNFGIDEHIVENMEDAKRILKRGGTLIPQKLSLFVAPIVRERPLRDINVWDDVGYNLDFSPAKEVALQNLYVQRVAPEDLLSWNAATEGRSGGATMIQRIPPWMRWDTIDFRKRNRSIRRGEVTWIISKATSMYGFAAWWEAELVPSVVLSTSPFKPPTHWEQIVLPLLSPLKVQQGDSVCLKLIADARTSVGVRVQWETLLRRRGKSLQKISMDMRHGEL